MSTKAIVKAWYNAGSQYIFWGISQISDPLSEYPTGSPGYPATNLLSDFVLLDYDGVNSDNYSDGTIINIDWGTGVTDGYAVYARNNGGTPEVRRGNASAFNSSGIIGVAFVESDKVITEGPYLAYCDGYIYPGDPAFLSTITGVLTADPPRTQNQTMIKVGKCIGIKLTNGVDKVSIYIDPEEPMFIEDTIDL